MFAVSIKGIRVIFIISTISRIPPRSALPLKPSISSINRALRINEKYGTVLKEGTHKSGYTYKATPGTEMIMKIFEGFIDTLGIVL